MSDDSWGDSSATPAPMTSKDGWGDDAGTRGRDRGGRGGGGGGGGSGACYKCGEEGHMSRECPNNAGGGGGGGRGACYKCGDEGHMSRECPNNAGGGGGGGGGRGACYKCGDKGHMSRECPNNAGGGGGGGGGRGSCYKCGEEGHMSRECPQNAGGGGGGGGTGTCYKCGEEGHMSRECPQNAGGGGDTSGCRNCGEEGHFARDCTAEKKPRGCYNCGEEGHIGKDCTNPRKPREGEEGPPKENYIPPEMLEGEAIFEERNKAFGGSGINFTKYESIPFEVTGAGKVASVETFQQLTHSELVLKNLEKCKYANPTPIQKHGSPQLLAGLDVMCCAQTGSGKTCAFLLPIITKLLQRQSDLTPAFTSPATPEALILAPTRELAIQIGKEANMYAAGSCIKTQVAYGGMATGALKNRIMNGCNILVGTTGRLKHFVNDGIISLSKVEFFVLDEADRMLDMGFMGDVDELVSKLPPKDKRVSGMFSATFAKDIQVAAKKFLKDYIYVVIGIVGGACADVTQEIIQVDRSEKRTKILEIIEAEPKDTKVLVFSSSKKGADFLASHLSTKGVSCTSIHGDRLQSQRELALYEFTTGKRQVLVATAVAARGLDIPKVALVINYDLPSEIDEYVHRIGRTGRVGHTGRAVSFYEENNDSSLAPKLVSILAGAGQAIPDFLGGGGSGFNEGGFASTDDRNGQGAAAADDDDW